jgi:hypothetical protein
MWGPGPQQGFQNALAMGQQSGNNFMNAFMQGRQMAEQRDYRNALAQFDPSKPETLQPIMAVRPEVGLQLRGQVQAQQAAAAKKQDADAGTFRQLLVQAGENPQQAIMAAQQLGIDTSRFPQPGTPDFEPWRQQQLFIVDALERDKDSLPGLAQEVMLALPADQRDPNGPAFRQAYTAALENKYAAEYTDAQGNTRRRAIIGQPQQQQAQPEQAPQAPVPTVPADIFQADVQSIGFQGAANFAVSRGLAVPIQSDEEFDMLPPGAAFIGPDGVARRKP